MRVRMRWALAAVLSLAGARDGLTPGHARVGIELPALSDEYRETTMEMFDGGCGMETLEKMQTIRKQYSDKGSEVVTADQKTSYEELHGKKYETLRSAGRGAKGKDKDK